VWELTAILIKYGIKKVHPKKILLPEISVASTWLQEMGRTLTRIGMDCPTGYSGIGMEVE
jgi:hypothetical protein